MANYNYYQTMGNTYSNSRKAKRDGYPSRIDRIAYDFKNTPTDKQIKYYRDMCSFLKEKGISYEFLERPRDKQHLRSIINALYTIINKKSSFEEFQEWSKNKELEGEF